MGSEVPAGRAGLAGLRGASASRPAQAHPPRPSFLLVLRSGRAVCSQELRRQRFRVPSNA